jgi:hypothetical protein
MSRADHAPESTTSEERVMALGKKQQKQRPSQREILALKKRLQAITKSFFDKYGSDGGKRRKARKAGKTSMAKMAAGGSEIGGGEDGGIDFLLIGPPGPRPPPKLEIEILNLSNY